MGAAIGAHTACVTLKKGKMSGLLPGSRASESCSTSAGSGESEVPYIPIPPGSDQVDGCGLQARRDHVRVAVDVRGPTKQGAERGRVSLLAATGDGRQVVQVVFAALGDVWTLSTPRPAGGRGCGAESAADTRAGLAPAQHVIAILSDAMSCPALEITRRHELHSCNGVPCQHAAQRFGLRH